MSDGTLGSVTPVELVLFRVVFSLDKVAVVFMKSASEVIFRACVVSFVPNVVSERLVSIEGVTDSVEICALLDTSVISCVKLVFVIVVVKIIDVTISVLRDVIVIGRVVADNDIVDK